MRHVNRRRWLTFGAGGAAVVVLLVGIGAAGAIAASRVLSPNDESKAVIDDAAKQLGVTPAELSDALKQALENRIDEAVDSGKLTEEQAKQLKERLDSDDYPLLFGPGLRDFGPGFGRHGHFGFGPGMRPRFDILESAAAYLGMSEAELRDALENKTLAEIAKDKGKTVDGLVNAIVAAEEKTIDEAVADGRITKAQASEIKSKLAEHVNALVNGELRNGERPHDRFWPGSGFPRGPPGLFGPRA
jgi:polyhydroxyalkanoate synthesis regulator phasin